MNEHHGKADNTLPFAKPDRDSGRASDGEKPAGEECEAMLDIIKQQPEINISRTVMLHGQIDSGRYRVNAPRVAKRLLDFEGRLQRCQDKGGRRVSSSGRSSGSSTSQDGSSN